MQTCRKSQPRPVVRAGAASGEAVTDPVDLAELLDVQVDHLARQGALVAQDRDRRIEDLSRPSPSRRSTRPTVERAMPRRPAMAAPVSRSRRKASITEIRPASTLRGHRLGTELRS